MHYDGGIGRLDDGRALDRVSRNEEGSVENRRRHRLFQVGPVDAPLAAARLRIDFRGESFRLRELRAGRRGARAQAQRDDFQPRLAVGRTASVELLVARIEALMQRSPERTADALLR